MEVKVARTGTTVYHRIVYQEQNRKACCDIAPGLSTVRYRAANPWNRDLYTPAFGILTSIGERAEQKTGAFLSTSPSHLRCQRAIWKLRGCTSCLAPSCVPSNHAAAESNLILPGGGVGASRCDTVATALGKVRASTVETIRCKTHLCPLCRPPLTHREREKRDSEKERCHQSSLAAPLQTPTWSSFASPFRVQVLRSFCCFVPI